MQKKFIVFTLFFSINISIIFSISDSKKHIKLKELEKKSFSVIFKGKRLKAEKYKDNQIIGTLEDGTRVAIFCSRDLNFVDSTYLGSFTKIKRKEDKKDVIELTCHVFKKELKN